MGSVFSTEKKILLGFSLAVLALVLVGALAFRTATGYVPEPLIGWNILRRSYGALTAAGR